MTWYTGNKLYDTLLLISLPKIDRQQQNSKWFKALDQAGGIVQVWPVDARELSRWLANDLATRRAASRTKRTWR